MRKTTPFALVTIAITVAACATYEPLQLEASEARSDALARTGYTATHDPIVLIPGFMGFETMLGIIDYFPGVAEALARGGADVYIVTASLADSPQAQSNRLIPQLEEIKAATGADRLNLFGHSLGAINARYIAAHRPDLVASVTSVGGPHTGTPVADLLDGGSLGTLPTKLLAMLTDLFSLLAGSTDPNDVEAAVRALSSRAMAEFNQLYPAGVPREPCGQGERIVDGIHYYSWSGVGALTNPIDLLDPLWLLTGFIFNEENDGMVGRCSSHLGKVIRDNYLQNHIDETNMLFGLVFPFGPKPVTLYRQHANRLKNAGL